MGSFKCGWKRFLVLSLLLGDERVGQDRKVEGVKLSVQGKHRQAASTESVIVPESARTKCWRTRPQDKETEVCELRDKVKWYEGGTMDR